MSESEHPKAREIFKQICDIVQRAQDALGHAPYSIARPVIESLNGLAEAVTGELGLSPYFNSCDACGEDIFCDDDHAFGGDAVLCGACSSEEFE